MCVVFRQAPLSNISEVQNCIMEELNSLSFVKENAQKLMERKVSFERREKKTTVSIHYSTSFREISQKSGWSWSSNCNITVKYYSTYLIIGYL